MEPKTELPLIITESARNNPYIMSGLAQKAFRLANYDMAPEDSVNAAIRQGLIVIEKPQQSAKIKRLPGNGSFA